MEQLVVKEDVPILSIPVEGIWRLVKSPGHERFAFDLVAVNLETRRTLSKSRFEHLLGHLTVEDSYSWSQRVLAPITGTVAAASDGTPDRRRLHLGRDLLALLFSRPKLILTDIRPFAGNHVILKAESYYVFLAHMRLGSIRVRQADKIQAGQTLGEVGNSGFTLEPHLHFQLLDQVDDLHAAKSLPFRVTAFERWQVSSWERVTNGELMKGEIVRFRSQN